MIPPVQGIAPSYLKFALVGSGASANSTSYVFADSDSADASTTESTRQLTTDFDMILKHVRVKTTANTKDGATTFSFRDDAADAHTAISVAAGGNLETTALNIDARIAAGSKINWKRDTAASTAGSITYYAVAYLVIP